MRLPRLVPVLVVTLLTPTCVATAQTTRATTPGAAATDIHRRVLLAGLSAYSPDARRDAQEKLIAMGESVEPGVVHAATAAVDPDARERARVVLKEIRTQRRLRDLTEPTRVTLHFDRAPARQVLASLYVRAGAQFRVFPPDPWESAGDAPVTVHLDNVPFWDAVRELEALTATTLSDVGWGASFVKVPPERMRGRVSVHGPFRVVAEDGPMPGSIRSLKVFLEPKIQVVWHARQAKLVGAGDGGARKDERKNPAHAWQADRWAESHVIGRSADVLEVEIPLDGVMRPTPHAKGTIPALLVAREVSVEDLPASASGSAMLAGQTFNWRLDSRTPEVHFLRVGPDWLIFAAAGSARPQQPLALAKELPAVSATLYDARGTPLLRGPDVRALARASYEWSFHQRLAPDAATQPRHGAAAAAAALRPPPPCGPPARIKLSLPTVTRPIEIPFEFGDPVKPR